MEYSKSYIDFKERIQEIFNFAVLVTLSVPVLKQNVRLFKNNNINRLPEPDYFEPSVLYEIKPQTISFLENEGIPKSQIIKLKELENTPLYNSKFKSEVIGIIGEGSYKKYRNKIKLQSIDYIENISDCTSDYQTKLASYLYFSLFSYFESFINELIKELIQSLERIDTDNYFANNSYSKEYLKAKSVLDKPSDPRRIDRYKKLSKQIREDGYKEPKELVFAALIDLLQSKVGELKANEIPDFLERYLKFQFQEGEKEEFHAIRQNRNSIGHGDNSFTPSLGKVIKANKFFKKISREINEHISNHYFRLNNYQS